MKRELMGENFARINVYFSEMETVIRKEVPSFTATQLLSDIGGTLGLWAGVSIITCVEILGLIAKYCSKICGRTGKL